MTFRDTPQDTETPPTGPFGVPPEYFGPPDGETALRADEMQANRIETQAMGALRTALHHPETGFASRPPTERLAALPEIQVTLDGIGETFRAHATTPRQRAILGPLLDNHLEHAATQVGRLAEQALAEADDGIVESRIGSLQQDAAVNWDDPARLRILGRAVVTERRSQGDRRGWDKTETETRGRQNASDFYATAIEAGIDKDIDRAGKLLTDAQGVLLPERQALLARKLAEAREAKHVAGIAGTLAAIPLDPATPPQPETYRARAEELTPDDAAPELRARIAQLADTAQRHATKYWQHDRNQAGLAAIDWMVSNPGAPVVTMDRKVAGQLSPEQRARLQEMESIGRLDTDPAVYAHLDRVAVYDPKTFAATDLSQYRLALDGQDYRRFTGFQKGDAIFARYDRGRTVLDAGLIKAQLDPDGPEARAARDELDKRLRSFEAIEGHPPTMADIDRVAGDIARGKIEDSNIARASGEAIAQAPSITAAEAREKSALSGEPVKTEGLAAARGTFPDIEPLPGSPEYKAAQDEADRLSGGRGIAPNTEPPPGRPVTPNLGIPVVLPDGSYIPDRYSRTGHLMAPLPDLNPVATAGREAGVIYRKIMSGGDPVRVGLAQDYMIATLGVHLGHAGLFDYQREGSIFTRYQQHPQWRNVSNVNVGLFCQQAGLSLAGTLAISGAFALPFSANRDLNAPYFLDHQTAEFIKLGHELGESGKFAGSASR